MESRSHTIPLVGVTQFPFEISLINLILPTFPHILRKFKTYFWWNTPCLAMNRYGIAKCLILTWYSLRNHGLNVELFEISLIYWIFPTLKGISHLCFRWNTPLICWCVDWKFGACSWRDNIIVWNHSYYNGIRGKPTIPTLDQTDLSTSRWMWLYAMEIYRGFMKF